MSGLLSKQHSPLLLTFFSDQLSGETRLSLDILTFIPFVPYLYYTLPDAGMPCDTA